MTILFSILIFILILGVLVLIHELGHFLAAKAFNIKVNEFGLGLPPRIWGIKKGETTYSLNWIPFGGFVGIEGEDNAGKIVERSFGSVNRFKRTIVLAAGVFMNFLLAIIIFSISFVQGVDVPTGNIQIIQVISGSPAASAGIKSGDIIVSADGNKVSSISDFQQLATKDAGHNMTVVVKRDSREVTTTIVPRVNPPVGQGALGVALGDEFVKKSSPWYLAPVEGTKYTITQVTTILSFLGQAISAIPSGNSQITNQLSGPVGIAYITYRVFQVDPGFLLSLTGLISLSLGLMNILPLPALDGGRITFVLLSALFRKDFYPKLEKYIHQFGLLAFLLLFIFITYHDVTRIVATTSLGDKVQQLIKSVP